MKVEIRTAGQCIYCSTLRKYWWQDGYLNLEYIGKKEKASLKDVNCVLLAKLSEAHMKKKSFTILIEEGFELGTVLSEAEAFREYKQTTTEDII